MTASHDVNPHVPRTTTHHFTSPGCLPLRATVGTSSSWNGSCAGAFEETSESMMSRYEHMIRVLAAQALTQQEEIARLRALLLEEHGMPSGCGKDSLQLVDEKTSAFRNEDTRNSTSGGVEKCLLPEVWRNRVEDHTVELLEAYMRLVDERLASMLVQRVRRVTREHVVRTVDKEIRCVLQEMHSPLQNSRCVRNVVAEDPHLQIPMVKCVAEPGVSKLATSTVTTASAAAPPSPCGVARVRSEVLSHRPPTTAKGHSQRSVFSRSPLSAKGYRVVDGCATATEPYVSTISCEPSLTDTESCIFQRQNSPVLGELTQKLAMLEDRLAAASAPHPHTDGSLATAVPMETKCSHPHSSSYSFFSSPPPSDSKSTINVSNDIDVLVDIFEGLRPLDVVQQLLP